MSILQVNETLVDVLYKEIKKNITERIFLPGQKLIVRELTEKYGVSETPIKQALNRLISEGLVENIPRKGIRVKKITWKEFEYIMEIRYMIESFCGRQAIRNINKLSDILNEFTNNVKQQNNIISNLNNINDYIQLYYLDKEFHRLLVKCSNNEKMIELYDNLGTHIYAYYVYGKQKEEGMIEGIKEHFEILNSILELNEKKLIQNIELHIENAKKKLFGILNNDIED